MNDESVGQRRNTKCIENQPAGLLCRGEYDKMYVINRWFRVLTAKQ